MLQAAVGSNELHPETGLGGHIERKAIMPFGAGVGTELIGVSMFLGGGIWWRSFPSDSL